MTDPLRILLIDGNDDDCSLLSLSIRNTLPGAEIVTAASVAGLSEALASGPFAAVVSEEHFDWATPQEAVLPARRLNPAAVVVRFTHRSSVAADDDIGLGIERVIEKNSAGFLSLPEYLSARLALKRELEAAVAAAAGLEGLAGLPIALACVHGTAVSMVLNAAFEQLAGRPAYALVDQPLAEYWELPPALAEGLSGANEGGAVQALAAARRQGGDAFLALYPLQRAQGRGRFWLCAAHPVQPGALRAAGSAGQVDEVRDLTLALAHDVQQPIQEIARQAEWLTEQMPDDSPSPMREALTDMALVTNRLQAMVDGILDYGRAGTLHTAPVDLNDIVADAVAVLREKIERNAATVEFADLPTLMLDRAQMQRVFVNLIDNALKFRSENVPRIKISAKPTASGYQIVVEDNGIGIPEDFVDSVFGMFKRLHGQSEYPGTGLGLAICRRIVEAHNGAITATSTPGRGTSFIIDLRAPARHADKPLEAVGR